MNINTASCNFMLIRYKKMPFRVQPTQIIRIFAATKNHQKGMLMTTKNETKDEQLQIDDKLVDTSTPQQMPSIWYT